MEEKVWDVGELTLSPEQTEARTGHQIEIHLLFKPGWRTLRFPTKEKALEVKSLFKV